MIRQATLTRANRKGDKSVSITFVTDLEQTSEEFMEIDKSLGNRGIIYFSERGELTQDEINELDAVDIELEGKSKSQRLRGVLFVAWSQGDKNKDFKEYYSHQMESIIEHFKSKLEP